MISQATVVKDLHPLIVSSTNFDMEDFSYISDYLMYAIMRMNLSTDPFGTMLIIGSYLEACTLRKLLSN